jgi:hypothetical protein
MRIRCGFWKLAVPAAPIPCGRGLYRRDRRDTSKDNSKAQVRSHNSSYCFTRLMLVFRSSSFEPCGKLLKTVFVHGISPCLAQPQNSHHSKTKNPRSINRILMMDLLFDATRQPAPFRSGRTVQPILSGQNDTA